MNTEKLKKILEDHKKWLNEEGGSRANLRRANLRYADLRRANLSYADLSYANLYDANLSYANLYGANLRGAYLRDANLYGAELYGAELYGADLSDAKQKIICIVGSRHSVYAIDDDVRIGCCRFPLARWLSDFKVVGEKQDYTPAQITEYGTYLKAIDEILKISRSEA